MITNTKLLYFGVLLTTCQIEKSLSATDPANEEELKMVSRGLNQFSTDFFKSLAEDETGNLICSPVSASMVLSMAAFGAGGETSKEMRSALHLPVDDSVVKNGFASVIDSLNNIKKVNLQLANKVFTATGFEVKSTFKEITAKFFKSEAQAIDFGNREAASSQINTWSSTKTNGRIQKVVKADDLIDAAMVLVNAVYFKGNWMKQFQKSLTSPKPFHINKETMKDVAMMQRTDTFNYGSLPDLDAVFVEIPYEHEDDNDATSMFIILPGTIDGLKKAENNLHMVDFKKLHDARTMTRVELSLPKFKAESSLQLKPVLTKMGMERMFSPAADFTGIADSPPLAISKVIQKAFIEVNEEGSEAAAVTAGIATPFSLPAPPVPPTIMNIERPFIYAIVHPSSNLILFQGHIGIPSS